MRSAFGLFSIRLGAVLALAVSAALWVDYTSAMPSFCGAGSGCAAVRASGYGYVNLAGARVPLPGLGLLGFALLLGMALTHGLLRWLPWATAIAGACGLFLFALQWLEVRQLCSLCVTVDALAVLSAISGLVLWRGTGDPNTPFGLRWAAWPALALLAVVAPLAWPSLRAAPPVPAGVRELYRPGKINVVEFADYECPFCRMLQPELKSVIASHPGQVNFTRLNLPLHSHPFARGAAEAQVCAREQGKGEDMADHLFAADDLDPQANRVLAQKLGVELTVYDQCIRSGRADRAIEQESKILLDNGLQGLPTTYVGAQTIIGAQPEEVFRDAFDRAEHDEGEFGIAGPIYWLAVLGLALGGGWVGRVRRATL